MVQLAACSLLIVVQSLWASRELKSLLGAQSRSTLFLRSHFLWENLFNFSASPIWRRGPMCLPLDFPSLRMGGAAAVSDRVQMGQLGDQQHGHPLTAQQSCVSPNTSLFHCCPGRWAWICPTPECSLSLFRVHVYPNSLRACIHTAYRQRKSPVVFQGDILILWVIWCAESSDSPR